MFSQKTQDLGSRLTKKQLEFAQRNTVNALAFETQKNAKENIQKKFITRNKFTERSVLVDRAARTGQPAVVGSTQDYMLKQEFGGRTEDPTLATSYSAGQAPGTQPRKKLPRKANKMANIRLPKQRITAKSKRQRNLIAVKQAKNAGSKTVYIDTGRRKFIAKVVGTKRKPQIKMLHDLSRTSTPVPRRRWLEPATDKALMKREAIWRNSLRFQLKRFK